MPDTTAQRLRTMGWEGGETIKNNETATINRTRFMRVQCEEKKNKKTITKTCLNGNKEKRFDRKSSERVNVYYRLSYLKTLFYKVTKWLTTRCLLVD